MSRSWKRGICVFICTVLLCSSFVVHAEDEQIKISDKEYVVSLQDANTIFMCNEKPISGEVGSKMFLTYTVEKVTKNTATVNGIVGTVDNTVKYPYTENGRMDYANKSMLFEEGYTYLFRFERTAEGYSYQCAKLKDDKEINIYFPQTKVSGDTDAYKYYGIWTDGKSNEGAGVSAMLNHVRCYDEKGNDLGLYFSKSTGMIQNEANELLDVHLTVRTNYSFATDKAYTVAIGSKYPTKSNIVYMEYEVADVTLDDTTQQGVMVTRSLSSGEIYPHGSGKGLLKFKSLEPDEKNKPLLRKGAKYFICFSKGEEGLDAIVQCTINGETETFSFPSTYGQYDSDFPYFALWFGEGSKAPFSASFKNFKCYDAEGNNLGVQFSRWNVPISLHGETEDYSTSKAVYYCEENNNFIILNDDKTATKQDGATQQQCTYMIVDEENLYLTFKGGKEAYKYTRLTITDENNNVYKRMKESKVTFVTGKEEIVVPVQAKNGYRVEEPDKPEMKNNTFKGWYLGDGTAFHFDTVVTESITLYAKWQDGDGNEYLAMEEIKTNGNISTPVMIGVVASSILLVGSIAGSIVIVRKGKKNGKN